METEIVLDEVKDSDNAAFAVIGIVIGLVGGFALGYILGSRRSKKTLVVPAEPKPPLPRAVPKEIIFDPVLERLLDEEAEIEKRRAAEDAEEALKVVNVFVNEDKDWDYELELQNRHSQEPYVIHQEEFVNDEMGFRQETLTYYAVDDIMADISDMPIYDYGGLMGELKFGHGSRDPSIVYIRNEVIHMEWEILLVDGSFEQEVLGNNIEKQAEHELKHSVHKFRQD